MLKKLIISLTFACSTVSFAGKIFLPISNEKRSTVTIELTNNTGMPLFLIAAGQADKKKNGSVAHRIRTIRAGITNTVRFKKLDSLLQNLGKNATQELEPRLDYTDINYFILTPAEIADTVNDEEDSEEQEESRPTSPAEFSRIPTITAAIPSKNTCYTIEIINGRLVLEEVA